MNKTLETTLHVLVVMASGVLVVATALGGHWIRTAVWVVVFGVSASFLVRAGRSRLSNGRGAPPEV